MPDVFLPPWASVSTDSSHFNRLNVAILGETNCSLNSLLDPAGAVKLVNLISDESMTPDERLLNSLF